MNQRTTVARNHDAHHVDLAPEVHARTELPLPPHIVIVPEDEERVHYECGHMACRNYYVDIWGHRQDPGPTNQNQTDFCPTCVAKICFCVDRVIRCPICERPIMNKDPVAVVIDNGSYDVEGIERLDDGSIIVCLRSSCCPTGGLWSGNWNGERFVPISEHKDVISYQADWQR